ncbi:MAG: hypothetical protein RSA27_07455 [Oscillospiraceae bacterium]
MVRGFFRNDESGKKYLYDIIGIKKETDPHRGVKPYLTTTKISGSGRPEGGFYDTNISQDDTSVNNNILKVSVK